MAVLSSAERQIAWELCLRDSDLSRETYGTMSKADLRAAVDAIDGFLESNKIALNNAIPQPARGAMTAKQKAKMLVWVVTRRYLTDS